MFRDMPGLFIADGVPVDLIRAGEPRLRRPATTTGELSAVRSPVRARLPLLRRRGLPLPS